MSTTTEPLITTKSEPEPGPWAGCINTVISLGLLAVLRLPLLLALALTLMFLLTRPSRPVKYLTLAVESTAVRYYNVTSDGRIDSNIRVGIRAGSPNPHAPPLNLTSFTLFVKKGKDNTILADSHLLGVFNLTAGSDELVHGEAFGLVPLPDRYRQWHFDAELVEAVRADLAAGEGIVDVELRGLLGKHIWLVGICEGVVIDCSGRSAVRAQKVDCRLRC